MTKTFGVDLPQDLHDDVVKMALAYARCLIIYHTDGDRSSLQHAAFMHNELNDLCQEAANCGLEEPHAF